MDRGAGQATGYGIAKGRIRLCDFHFPFHGVYMGDCPVPRRMFRNIPPLHLPTVPPEL